ncbi:MAG: hypothetical protein K2X87_19775 [Gemmataceae bacterium]|nr:hypothetical protein [Gemmataceae bacterium]
MVRTGIALALVAGSVGCHGGPGRAGYPADCLPANACPAPAAAPAVCVPGPKVEIQRAEESVIRVPPE